MTKIILFYGCIYDLIIETWLSLTIASADDADVVFVAATAATQRERINKITDY